MSDKENELEIIEPNVEPEFKAYVPLIDLLKDKKAVDSIERLVSSVMNASRKSAKSERWFQGIGVVALILAVSILSYVEVPT